jgi:hypothetical protein
MTDIVITERGTRDSVLGPVLQIKVFAPGYRPLAWREVWDAFATAYPGRWAVQVFPPAGRLIDSKAVYHLFVCEQAPGGLDLHDG